MQIHDDYDFQNSVRITVTRHNRAEDTGADLHMVTHIRALQQRKGQITTRISVSPKEFLEV
jgi:hypothetical protein